MNGEQVLAMALARELLGIEDDRVVAMIARGFARSIVAYVEARIERSHAADAEELERLRGDNYRLDAELEQLKQSRAGGAT
ncbi:MAG TPA: hypothetical protein VF814_04670 [Casimicrobiaceae bacterium]